MHGSNGCQTAPALLMQLTISFVCYHPVRCPNPWLILSWSIFQNPCNQLTFIRVDIKLVVLIAGKEAINDISAMRTDSLHLYDS